MDALMNRLDRRRRAPRTGWRWRAPLLVAAVAAALVPVRAAAHPYLVSAEPAAGSTVRSTPEQIGIFYTESLDAPYCSVTLVAPDGGERPLPVSVSGTRLTATPPALDAGTYVVRWTVVGEDGHRVVGDFPFNVRTASANPSAQTAAGGVTGYDTLSDVSPVELVGRSLLAVITVLLAGLLVLGFVILPRDPALRPAAGRRLARLRTALWTSQIALAAALAAVLVHEYGAAALLTSLTGKLVVLRLLLTLALVPAVLDGGVLAAGRPPERRTGAYGVAVALMLLGALTLSGHALADADRSLSLTILGVHLLSISLWIGAILAVVAACGTGGEPALSGLRREAGRFTPLVGASIAVMVATGLYNAHVNLRSLGQLGSSTYGRVLDAKVGLVALMVAAGLAAAAWRRRSSADGRPERRRPLVRARAAHVAEGAIAALVLTMAGVLAQTPNPVSFPYPSQLHAQPAGTPLAAASNGRHIVPLVVTPGVPGPNRVIAGVDMTDDNDLLVPVQGVDALEVTATCSCPAPARRIDMRRVGGGPWFAGEVTLGSAGAWTLEARPRVAGVLEEPAVESAGIEPAGQPGHVLVGVAADLSGPDGQRCQDAAIGLQTAAVEANQAALANGDPVRLVAVDTRADGAAAAVDRLARMHVTALAMPCGDTATTSAVTAAAAHDHLPVVGAPAALARSPWVWTTFLADAAEGAALADQAASRHCLSALLLVGHEARDADEARAATLRLRTLGIPTRELAIDHDPAPTLAERVRALNPGSLLLVASPGAALPVLQALGSLQPEWSPPTGALAASSLMSNSLASDAGGWILRGRVTFASEVDPDDTAAITYASRLEQWYGGRRPSFDGVRGYVAGWVVNNLLRDVGADRSPQRLVAALRSDFGDFSFGSYQLRWAPGGGGAAQLAFFTTVFTNPLTLLGAPPATNHAGIFLRAGAYVRISPYAEAQT
jgi:copper transport protein